jgi:ATP-dependent Clp protease adapter protein ClpS
MGKTLHEKAPRKTEVPRDSGDDPASGWMTILFNDEVHTFQEVAQQLVKAVRCSLEKGLAFANVVHHTGSAIVYRGPKERCEAVADVLEQIRLKTQVCR